MAKKPAGKPKVNGSRANRGVAARATRDCHHAGDCACEPRLGVHATPQTSTDSGASTRQTPQRNAVREALAGGSGPMSAKEILDAAAAQAPGIGMATVYRALKLLADEGLVAIVEIPGQPPRYELTGQGHHHHLYCRGCSKVFEIMQCPGDFADLCPPGFKVEGHELVLFGLCPECAK
jgi:Fur family ferric uptake transcriptional regulator